MNYTKLSQRIKRDGFLSGIRNCHVPGVYSLVIQNRQSTNDGMLRIFYTGPESQISSIDRDGDFAVMPHNHRQDLTLYKLFGSVKNARLSLHHGHDGVHEYVFESQILSGELALKYSRPVTTGQFEIEPMHTDGIHMNWAALHTVTADPISAWLVEEGRLAPEEFVSVCYSRSPKKEISMEGLYEPMNGDQLDYFRDLILDKMSEEVLGYTG